MRNLKRIVLPGILNHCYQNTQDGYLIFYSVSDYLALFTIICIAAPRYGVRILAMCFMPDHLHGSFVAHSASKLSAFVGYYTSEFVKMHNTTLGRKGPLFNHPYGSAVKKGDKKARTNLIYVYNNPVERRLSRNAEEYRWNFLAYAKSDHPFSEPLVKRKASGPMKNAIALVDALHKRNRPLTYKLLQTMFSKLEKKEKNQLSDYIVVTYSVIDYKGAIRFFDSYDNLLTAVHSTTGSEYDLNESDSGKRDDVYAKMISELMKNGRFTDIHQIISLPIDDKFELFKFLSGKTEAQPEQIANFLHMPLIREKRV